MSVKVNAGISGNDTHENGSKLEITKDGDLLITDGGTNSPAIAIYARGYWQKAWVITEDAK